MNKHQLIRLMKNTYRDMPEFAEYTITIIVVLIVSFLISKVGPLTGVMGKFMFGDYFNELNRIIQIIFTILYGLIQLVILAAVGGICYLLYRAFIFIAIEIKICKLPDDYFSSRKDISAEELCKLLEPFHFHGHIIDSTPGILEVNIPVLERIMSKYTKEQLLLIKNSPTSEYFGFYAALSKMIREKNK